MDEADIILLTQKYLPRGGIIYFCCYIGFLQILQFKYFSDYRTLFRVGSLEEEETGAKGRLFKGINVYCIGRYTHKKTRQFASHAIQDGLCYAQIRRTTRGYFLTL